MSEHGLTKMKARSRRARKTKTKLPSHRVNNQRFATIGGRIRAVRLARGYTHHDVAAACLVTRNSVSMWETGSIKKPNDKVMERFAKLVRVPYEWVTERKGPDPKLPLIAPRISRSVSGLAMANANDRIQAVPELDRSTPASHAKRWNVEPRAWWGIPKEVLEVALHCAPENTVIKASSAEAKDIKRSDYMFIDKSRTDITEPGVYTARFNGGPTMVRILATAHGGKLRIRLIDSPEGGRHLVGEEKILKKYRITGRVMGVLRAM